MQSNKVPVTVVIPCFRCSSTVMRAVNSVMQQTQLPAEIILVDDASGDDTLGVLRNIARAHQGWIKIIELKMNSGAAEARNAGWALAAQPYVAFLDSDDTWHKKKLEIQYGYMESHLEVVLCGHAHRLLKGNDSSFEWAVDGWGVASIDKWPLLLSNRFITPSVMVRRDILQRFRSGQRHMEDHLLWLEILCGGGKVTKLSAELAAIHKNQFGASGLSAQLWLMEKGDLNNYKSLYFAGCINLGQWLILSIYSWIKFIRRLLICWSIWLWKK